MSLTESLAARIHDCVNLQNLLSDLELLHSEFQIRWFMILKNGVTQYGCYKQALLEIHSRLQALNAASAQIVSIEALSSCDAERTHVESNDKQVEDLIRELKLLYEIATNLKSSIGQLNSERRYQLEAELWSERVKKMAVIDFISLGRLSRETIEILLVLPLRQRMVLIDEVLSATNHERLICQVLVRPDCTAIAKDDRSSRLPMKADETSERQTKSPP